MNNFIDYISSYFVYGWVFVDIYMIVTILKLKLAFLHIVQIKI